MSEAAGLCEIFLNRSGFWTFIFCLFLVWTPVKGGLHLIGSSQPIVAAPGDDVILPCRVEPEWDAVGKTVEWSRPDLRPTGPQKRVEYVFVYRFRKTDRDMMMDTYIQRTSLSQDGLRRGDVSLTIRNVSLQDQGRFRCFIPRLGVEAELLLVVDPNFVSTTTTETVSHRNLITLTPQEETSRNGWVRFHLCLIVFSFFIICLGPVSLCVIRKWQQIQKPQYFLSYTINNLLITSLVIHSVTSRPYVDADGRNFLPVEVSRSGLQVDLIITASSSGASFEGT